MREIVKDEFQRETEITEKIWTNNLWINDVRIFYNYYEGINIIDNAFCQVWRNSWENSEGAIIVDLSERIRIGFITYKIKTFYSKLVDIQNNIKAKDNDFYLAQNYPNPFNPTTTINFSIPEQSLVTLKIYNALGEEVKTLVNELKSVGNYEIKFDASKLSSGIYFYRLKADNYIETKKMLMLK